MKQSNINIQYPQGKEWINRRLDCGVSEELRKNDRNIVCKNCDIGTGVSDIIYETLRVHRPGLEQVLGWTVKNNIWSKLGLYDHDPVAIRLSSRWLVIGSKDLAEHTIKHECAHAISHDTWGSVEGGGHGSRWKEVCDQLGIKSNVSARELFPPELVDWYTRASRGVKSSFRVNCERCKPIVPCPACNASVLRPSYDKARNLQTKECYKCKGLGTWIQIPPEGSIHLLNPFDLHSSELTITENEYRIWQKAYADLHQESVRILKELRKEHRTVIRLSNRDHSGLDTLRLDHNSIVGRIREIELILWTGRLIDPEEKRAA